MVTVPACQIEKAQVGGVVTMPPVVQIGLSQPQHILATPVPATPVPQMMQIQCPAEAPAGTTIKVQAPNGRALQVQVPPGVAPGTVFTIQY